MLSRALPLALSLLLASAVDAASSGESIAQQVADLKLAPTANDRLKVLDPDSSVRRLAPYPLSAY